MTRPLDWSPLADTDPVKGEAHAVTQEGKYYSDVATEISDQVTRLRTIAAEGEMLGKTADKLRESAGDLADKLEKTHGRFATVGSALTAWVPYLETAQQDTLQAYNDAQDAVADQKRYAAPPTKPVDPSAPPLTDAQKTAAATADRTRQNNLDDAIAALTAAQKKFNDAVADRDRHAKVLADRIRGALHDGLKDGFWDHVSHWVSQHLKMINMILTVLSWAVTILAVVALFASGGWILMLAIGLAAIMLAGHTLEAATGNGSWMDVAIDVFTLATLGAGGFFASGARAARVASLARGGVLEGDAARTTVTVARAGEKQLLKQTAGGFVKRLFSSSARAANRSLQGFDAATESMASKAAAEATAKVIARELPEDLPRIQGVKALGRETAVMMADKTALDALYGGDKAFDALSSSWNLQNQATRVSVAVGESVDVIDKALGDSIPGIKPVNQAYMNFKDTAGEDIGKLLHLPGVDG